MKRLNRKNLIKDFEQLREGFSQAVLRAVHNDDITASVGFAAHYTLANRRIVELGGDAYQIEWLVEYYKEGEREMCKALKGLMDENEKLVNKTLNK